MAGISNDRMQHSLAVARKMREWAKSMIPSLPKDKCEELFMLGYLHDIGYEFTHNQDDHAHVGGEILNRQGFKYWKEVYCHGDPDADYWSDALHMLNIVNLTTDSNGKDVDAKERLDEIEKQCGKDSKQYINAEKLAKKIGLICDKPLNIIKGPIANKMCENMDKIRLNFGETSKTMPDPNDKIGWLLLSRLNKEE